MKVKARDIIPGWPRPKSTSQPEIPQVGDRAWWMRIGRAHWPDYELRELQCDWYSNALYHDWQGCLPGEGYREFRLAGPDSVIAPLLFVMWGCEEYTTFRKAVTK